MPMSMEQTVFYLQAIAKGLDDILNGKDATDKKIGFVLWTFEFNHAEGEVNYVSNANREDMIKVVDEWRERQNEAR